MILKVIKYDSEIILMSVSIGNMLLVEKAKE